MDLSTELVTIAVKFAVLVPVVVALTEVIKRAISLSSRYTPLLSLAVSMLGTIVISDFSILASVLVGLAASGLYDFGSKTVLNR